MGYKIVFKKSVSRDLRKIDKVKVDRILKRIQEYLPEKADRLSVLTGKFAGLRKFRVGDYRIIFTIIEDTCLVLKISHRREVYR